MPAEDFDVELGELRTILSSIETVLDLDKMRAEIADLSEEVAVPDLWNDQANAQRVTGRLSVLQSEYDRVTGLRARLDDLAVLVELAQAEDDEDEFPDVPAAPAALLAALKSVPDPRKRRGLRHEMSAILAIAVCAVIAGARSFVAIAEWTAVATPNALATLGVTGVVPCESTIRRTINKARRRLGEEPIRELFEGRPFRWPPPEPTGPGSAVGD